MSKAAQVRFLLALLGLILIIIIGVQNSEIVEIRLLLWTVHMDRSLLFLLLFMLGAVGGMMLSWLLQRGRRPRGEETDSS